METPVIYFYTPRQTALSIGVSFTSGIFTEWYPQAERMTGSRIEWKVEARPGEAGFPTGVEANHYYEARATDSVPLRAGSEEEKLIFYRGVGSLPIPVRPRFTAAGRIELDQAGKSPVAGVILFEKRGANAGFRLAGELRGKVEIDPPYLTGDTGQLRARFERALVSAGLYPKEAAAMVATWRDSWFEEGMRLFYLMPRGVVDEALPMTIQPAPGSIERVFVGRIELLSPRMREDLAAAAARRDREALAKYGRFLQVF
jgi:hypothetical protein